MATATARSPLQSKVMRLEEELKELFFEREDLIRVMILSIVTRQHCLIFGKHGAAKSSLIRALANGISCGFFGIQIGKDTTRDEVFGPIKVSKLPEDRLCRAYERFLPGNPIVFLDEIDKGNSIIQNSLYTAMEERLFLDDGAFHPIPLISLFGAANNIGQFQTDALAPLLDRFLFRVEVDWIQSDACFLEFVRRRAEQDYPVLTTTLSMNEIAAMHLEAQQISFPRSTQESIAKLRKDLAAEEIFASDRRWGYIIDLLKAIAFLNGDRLVSEEHFLPLRHVLWTDKKQIPTIDRLLKAMDQGVPQRLKGVIDSLTAKVDATLEDCNPQSLLGQATLIISDLQALQKELSNLPQTARTRTALGVIQQKTRQVETHRKNICNV